MVCARPVAGETLAVLLSDLHRLTLEPPLRALQGVEDFGNLGAGKVGMRVLAEGGTLDPFSFLLSFQQIVLILQWFCFTCKKWRECGAEVGLEYGSTQGTSHVISFDPHYSLLVLVLLFLTYPHILLTLIYIQDTTPTKPLLTTSLTSPLASWAKPQLSLTWTILRIFQLASLLSHNDQSDP